MSETWDDDLEILPDTTTDESAEGWGDAADDSNDERLAAERPPHWS
jgi:hypothetical protein